MSTAVSTARTPGIATAFAVSIERITAWACGLRRVLPKSIPGATRSEPKLNSPRTLAGASGRGTDSPIPPRGELTIAHPLEALACGPGPPGKPLLVSGQEPAFTHDPPPVDDHRLGAGRWRQRD